MVRQLRCSVAAVAVILGALCSAPTLVAHGATGPAATVSPGALDFGAVVEGTSSAPGSVTVSDSGTSALTVSGVTTSMYQTSDFAVTTSQPLPATLQPGASMTISVVFTPSAGGGRSTFLEVSDNDPSGMQTVELAGTGVQEGVSLSTSILSFGTWTVGLYSPEQWLTVTNTDPAAELDITGIAFDANASSWATSTSASPTFPDRVLPGQSVQVGVFVQPQVTGSVSADLVITDNRTGTTQIEVSGGGTTEPADVSVSPTALSYGSVAVGAASSQTVTIGDWGSSANVAIWAIRVTGTNAADFSVSTPYTIPPEGVALTPGATLGVTVTFSPTATGARSATLEVQGTHQNDCCDVLDVALGGTGVQPQAAVTPSSVGFGSVRVGTASSTTVGVQNTGSGDLHITTWGVTGSADFSVSPAPTAPLAVGPGASVTFTVTFAPTAAASESATLAFTDDAPGSPQSVPLAGTGVQPQATPSTRSLAFGTVALGSSASRQVALSNTGSAPLTITGWSVAGASDFSVAGPQQAPLTVAPGSSATFTVTFAPTHASAESATLAFSDDAPGSPQSVALSGTGTVSADVSVTLAQSATHVRKNGTQTYTITVRNAGPSAASGVVLSDAVPANTVFASVTTTSGTCTAPARGGTGSVTCSPGTMAAGASVTVTLTVTFKANTSVTDTASVSATSSDPVPANNSASVTASYP